MENIINHYKKANTIGHYDTIVLGGGPSGICATIEAARNSAKPCEISAKNLQKVLFEHEAILD